MDTADRHIEPGSPETVRDLEHRLRAAGWSKQEARAEVARLQRNALQCDTLAPSQRGAWQVGCLYDRSARS